MVRGNHRGVGGRVERVVGGSCRGVEWLFALSVLVQSHLCEVAGAGCCGDIGEVVRLCLEVRQGQRLG